MPAWVRPAGWMPASSDTGQEGPDPAPNWHYGATGIVNSYANSGDPYSAIGSYSTLERIPTRSRRVHLRPGSRRGRRRTETGTTEHCVKQENQRGFPGTWVIAHRPGTGPAAQPGGCAARASPPIADRPAGAARVASGSKQVANACASRGLVSHPAALGHRVLAPACRGVVLCGSPVGRRGRRRGTDRSFGALGDPEHSLAACVEPTGHADVSESRRCDTRFSGIRFRLVGS
jgi:hypothetical protein